MMPHKPCLLIVDDEQANRDILKRTFRDCGILEAEDSQEALAYLASESIDVVLLDIMMPGVSGLDLLPLIRQTRSLSELPIILISALDASEIIASGLLAGANDYITKPIDIDVVRARVQTQIQLRQYALDRQILINRLQAVNTMKERLMLMASHDLKNPLQNLSLTNSLIRDTVGDDPELKPLLDIAGASIQNMLSVIQQQLDMNVGTTQTLYLKAVDIDKVFKQVADQYTSIAAQKDIHLEPVFAGAAVQADQYRLVQILNNMVSNAIKYSPRETTVMLYAHFEGNLCYICVRDQGPGIPIEERDSLFEQFQRGSNLPTAGESSTGLGLWIVREMAEQQQGAVGVECPDEGGSIFWVRLPVVTSVVDIQ
jgi:two-component system, sensor histidine kinase and response regulator